MSIRLVAETPPPDLTAKEYFDTANAQWGKGRVRLTDILREVSNLSTLLYGQTPVKWHHVKGALHTTKKLRDECDRLIEELTQIVEAGHRVKEQRSTTTTKEST